MKPLVSVILPVHNGEKFLLQALLSVQNQTYENWELIIINDGSTDNTGKIIDAFLLTESRVRVLTRQKSGIVKSLNFGIANANGELIARIDSDDIWLQGKLQYQIDHFEKNKNLYLFGASVILIDEIGQPLSIQKGFNNRKYFSHNEIKRSLLRNNLFCHSSVMFRKELINEIGLYNENFRNSEDYEFWIRAASKVECEITDKIFVHYRIWPQTVSQKRREEQILFSLRARLKGFFSMGNLFLNFLYLLKFLVTSTMFLCRKKIIRLTKTKVDI